MWKLSDFSDSCAAPKGDDRRELQNHLPAVRLTIRFGLIECFKMFQDRRRIDGFDQMNVESSLRGLLFIFLTTPSCNGNEYCLAPPRLLAKTAGGLEAIQLRHSNIEDNDLWPKLCRLLQNFETVSGCRYLVAEHVKHDFETFENVVIIVSD